VSGVFDFSHFTPHGFCLAWDPWLIWLMAGSDLLIAAAYFSIPAALLLFLQRRTDLAFKPVFGLFAAFILACGATHVLGALTLWLPAYRLAGGLNGLTALLSVATALTLWPLIPKAIALPSPAALREANEALGREMQLRDEAAQRLRDSELRQKQIYARTPAALYAVDADGVLLDVSDRWLDLTGATREEAVGRNITEFYTASSQMAFHAQVLALQRGLLPSRGERQLLRSDGSVRDLDIVLEPEYDAQGTLLRILGSATDVTARKAAEAALRLTEEHLRQSQKMEAVGQLTGGIAHDFNNLLTTIMGSLELLQQRSALDARGERLVGNALEGSRRAARLTSQLLSFSRRQRLAAEILHPADIIDGIHDLLARTLGDGITLEVRLPEEPWQLLADRNQMEAALLNLVINARDSIAGHVRIEIANRRLDGSEINFDGPDRLAPGDYVSVAVCDDGAGMAEAVRLRALEPFFTTKGPGVGTGLGLSQTYGFASQSGGTVRIESTLGQGSRIEMFLPRAPVPAASPFAPDVALSRARDGRGEHILLVEDDTLLRQTMTEALRDRGYEVTAAKDGADALHILADTRPARPVALLFTDIVMPGGMNGVALALEARKLRAALPVLFATGYSATPVLQTWQEPLDLLPKPYSPEDAAARIAARLDAIAPA
jgi:PAS domain S-box-containing protein